MHQIEEKREERHSEKHIAERKKCAIEINLTLRSGWKLCVYRGTEKVTYDFFMLNSVIKNVTNTNKRIKSKTEESNYVI